MEIVAGILIILLGISVYIIVNLFKKVEFYERYSGNLENWFETFKIRMIQSYERIKAIDRKGSFEADDEVGFIFKEIKEVISYLVMLTGEEVKEEKSTGNQ